MGSGSISPDRASRCTGKEWETILPNEGLVQQRYQAANEEPEKPHNQSQDYPMSIRLASPRHSIRNRMDVVEARCACRFPANDNTAKHASKATLRAALRHFSNHGLAAAEHARQQAEKARAKGDEQTYEWWLEICRALDRRMASQLAAAVSGN